MNSDLLSQGKIIAERGWSKAMIEKLLGSPDKLQENPYYRSAAPMRMYSIERVQKVEASPEYQALLEKRQKRGQIGRAAADRKRAELRAEVESYDISLPAFALEDLAKRAAENYISHQIDIAEMRANRRGQFSELPDFDFKFKPWDEPDSFRDRCSVNFLRHCCTHYEKYLALLTRRIGKDEAYMLLNERIGKMISNQYPMLANAVSEQLRRKREGAA